MPPKEQVVNSLNCLLSDALQDSSKKTLLNIESPLMDHHLHSYTFFLCFLLSWGFSGATTSTDAAAYALHNRGYSLFASTIHSSTTTNFSGTVLAPPDFAFNIFRANPPLVLLLYHTLKTPLTWFNLSTTTFNAAAQIPTLYNNNCLFLFKTSTGEISISSTHQQTVTGSNVIIRQPDIYVDDHLTIHGIDGVLDPTEATECSSSNLRVQNHRRYLLEHAIKALRRRRFTIAATALTIKRSELLSLDSVSVFAPSDMALLSRPDGFHYDYRHHVVPERHDFLDLARIAEGTVVFESLAPNKTLVVNSVQGAVTVNGVIVNNTEVYRNRWIVVFSVSTSLDDASSGNLLHSGSFVPSPAPAIIPINHPDEIIDGYAAGTPSPSPVTMEIHYSDEATSGSIDDVQSIPDFLPSDEFINSPTTEIQSPSPSMVQNEVIDPRCVFGIPVRTEGGDLFCPASGPRQRNLQEIEDLTAGHVSYYTAFDEKGHLAGVMNQSAPLSSNESDPLPVEEHEHIRTNIIDQNHRDHINMADDLFFYF